MKELNKCHIDYFDDIFYATKESQGYENAVLAIKYVLFDDDSVFENTNIEKDKYVYISKNKNARKKAMVFQQDDLAHILIKYCMASFGLRCKDFTITEEEFEKIRERIEIMDIPPYEMIELISYATIGDIYIAYQLLYANQKNLSNVVEYMIEERYISKYRDELDKFNGIIENMEVPKNIRYKYYETYATIDDSFAEIKRNNNEYLK